MNKKIEGLVFYKTPNGEDKVFNPNAKTAEQSKSVQMKIKRLATKKIQVKNESIKLLKPFIIQKKNKKTLLKRPSGRMLALCLRQFNNNIIRMEINNERFYLSATEYA